MICNIHLLSIPPFQQLDTPHLMRYQLSNKPTNTSTQLAWTVKSTLGLLPRAQQTPQPLHAKHFALNLIGQTFLWNCLKIKKADGRWLQPKAITGRNCLLLAFQLRIVSKRYRYVSDWVSPIHTAVESHGCCHGVWPMSKQVEPCVSTALGPNMVRQKQRQSFPGAICEHTVKQLP